MFILLLGIYVLEYDFRRAIISVEGIKQNLINWDLCEKYRMRVTT